MKYILIAVLFACTLTACPGKSEDTGASDTAAE
jgi:hypothetical protein